MWVLWFFCVYVFLMVYFILTKQVDKCLKETSAEGDSAEILSP